MEVIIQICMLFILLAMAVRHSFGGWMERIALGLICLGFVILTHPYALEQTKPGIDAYLSVRTLRENLAILITIEAFLMVLYSFSMLSSGRMCTSWADVGRILSTPRLWGRILAQIYPGLLIFPVLFYLHTELIFAMPGVDFSLLSWSLALGVGIGLPLLSWLMDYLLPEWELRLEVLFLVSLFIFILGLISTVDERITYQPAPMEYHLEGIVMAIGIFALFFLIGRYSYIARDVIRRIKLRK